MNSLPKTVTRQRHDSDLTLGPSAPESSTLTTRLVSGFRNHTKTKAVLVLSTVLVFLSLSFDFFRSQLAPQGPYRQ